MARLQSQPIAIEDVVAYLAASIEAPIVESEIIEIGGPERMSYIDLLREYARQRGLNRVIVPVPVLTPRLSSLWLSLVTPVQARTGRRLIEGLRNETIVTDPRAHELFPGIHPRNVSEAIGRALANEDREFTETHWTDARPHIGERRWRDVLFGRHVDSRAVEVDVSAEHAFEPIARIGRTFGRFWRVESIEPGRLLRLRAEMRRPGRAWLQFEVTGDRPVLIRQTATFDPIGLFGLLCWYSLYPVHTVMFEGMLHAIARSAHRRAS